MSVARGAGLVLLALTSTAAVAQELPPSLDAMIREAKREERKAVVDVAKRLYPSQTRAINDLVVKIEKDEKAAAGEASFVQGWSGEAVFGGFRTTGNTDEWGVSASLSAKRAGPRWTHEMEVRVDVKEEDKERTEERGYAKYTIRRAFENNSRWFAFGRLSFERDHIQGINSRFFEAAGVGYQIARSRRFTWDVMVGPGVRQSSYIDGRDLNEFGVFLRTRFDWKLTDTLRFSEEAESGLTGGNKTFVSTTALTSNLYGRLSGRISYSVENESEPPPGREETDTYLRASLVYDF